MVFSPDFGLLTRFIFELMAQICKYMIISQEKGREITMLIKKMQNLKDETKMSYQDIADKSGIPISTVKRIFSGQTPDPGYTSVLAIIEAMGGTAEDMKDDTPKEQKSETVSKQSVELLCSVYEHTIADKNKLIKALLIIVLSMMAIFIFLLVWDLCNPNIGFFRR